MRGKNLRKHLPPKAVRLQNLGGLEALAPGEVSKMVRIRGPKAVLEAFEGLTPKERGEAVRLVCAKETLKGLKGLALTLGGFRLWVLDALPGGVRIRLDMWPEGWCTTTRRTFRTDEAVRVIREALRTQGLPGEALFDREGPYPLVDLKAKGAGQALIRLWSLLTGLVGTGPRWIPG